MMLTKVGGIYRHYKGGLYRVLHLAQDETNGNKQTMLVVYIALGDGKIFARAEGEFHGMVSTPNCPIHGNVPEGETYEGESEGRGHTNCWRRVTYLGRPRFEYERG